MAYSVLTLLQYIIFLATRFDIYKTNFRVMWTIGTHIQCVRTLWDPIVFTQNHKNHENFSFKMQVDDLW